VAASRKEDQCLFLAALIALKYPALEVPATSRMCGVSCFCGRSSGLVILTTEDRQVGGLPRFGVMGRPGYWRVLFEESYQTVERF